jgi:selenide,water dikinase
VEKAEDAGIYRLSDELALVQTVDFFTPIVDDPYDFGQIAAANALSDVYATGGRPLTALNVVCFPQKVMDMSILRDILTGGLDKMREAGVVLVGGHTIEDDELKYGLAVTGTVDPDRVVLNRGCRVGDRLVLTKPLGTGIISTALKGGMADEAAVAAITRSMAELNRKASELMQETGVSACTDVTGFGLLGHAAEMVQDFDKGMVINAAAVPVFDKAREYARMALLPGGLHRNRDFRSSMVAVESTVPDYLADILYDPQTSGGLLISVPAEKAAALLQSIHSAGIDEAAIIGEVVAEPAGRIIVR